MKYQASSWCVRKTIHVGVANKQEAKHMIDKHMITKKSDLVIKDEQSNSLCFMTTVSDILVTEAEIERMSLQYGVFTNLDKNLSKFNGR